MTNKEKFLQSIMSQIAVLQQAYDANKALPDAVFDSFFTLPVASMTTTETVAKAAADNAHASAFWNITSSGSTRLNQLSGALSSLVGSTRVAPTVVDASGEVIPTAVDTQRNKNFILGLLDLSGEAMTQRQILDTAAKSMSKADFKDRNITYALHSLKDEKKIQPYLPEGRTRGAYYGLAEWFERENDLKAEYIPSAIAPF